MYTTQYDAMQLSDMSPQWGTADAEIKVPSGEITELKRSPLKTQSRSVAIHATLTARDFFLAYFYPSGPLTCIFFPKPLPISPVLVVANRWFRCRPAE